MLSNNGEARAKLKSLKVLKYVIQSTVNNLQGARLVESLLLKKTMVREIL